MLPPEVLMHFKSRIPFDRVQKVMEGARDMEPDDGVVELAEPLPAINTTERWNFTLHGDVKWQEDNCENGSSVILMLIRAEQSVNILVIISDCSEAVQ